MRLDGALRRRAATPSIAVYVLLCAAMDEVRQLPPLADFAAPCRDAFTLGHRENSRLSLALFPGTLRVMARTNAQKRAQSLAAGRARQDRRREKLSAMGKPITSKVDAALVEALAFEIAAEVLEGARADAYVSVASLMETALAVLCDRQGYDRRQAKIAIATRMSLRLEHSDPSYIPSLRPDPAAQSARTEIQR